MMNIGIPQAIVLLLFILPIGVHLARHGESRIDEYNFFGAVGITVGVIALLWWGGFFK